MMRKGSLRRSKLPPNPKPKDPANCACAKRFSPCTTAASKQMRRSSVAAAGVRPDPAKSREHVLLSVLAERV
jgi:hypothetical protein